MNPHLNKTTQTFHFRVTDMVATDGVQKVKGFSRGYHHANSVRLGIRKENDYYVLYLYAYDNYIRINKRMCVCYLGDVVTCTLKMDRYIISADVMINHKPAAFASHARKNPTKLCPIGYDLRPYFELDKPFSIYFLTNDKIN